jgi:hypothetical protein
MWGSRPSHMLENTLFRGLFQTLGTFDQVTPTIVTKPKTLHGVFKSAQCMGLESSILPPTDGGGFRDFYHNLTNSIYNSEKKI